MALLHSIFYLLTHFQWIGNRDIGIQHGCCFTRTVKNLGTLNGVFKYAPDVKIIDENCADDCIYTKEGDPDKNYYCFKSDPGVSLEDVVCEEIPATTTQLTTEKPKKENTTKAIERAQDFLEFLKVELAELKSLSRALGDLESTLNEAFNRTRKKKEMISKNDCHQLLENLEEFSYNLINEKESTSYCLRKISENVTCNDAEKESLKTHIAYVIDAKNIVDEQSDRKKDEIKETEAKIENLTM